MHVMFTHRDYIGAKEAWNQEMYGLQICYIIV